MATATISARIEVKTMASLLKFFRTQKNYNINTSGELIKESCNLLHCFLKDLTLYKPVTSTEEALVILDGFSIRNKAQILRSESLKALGRERVAEILSDQFAPIKDTGPNDSDIMEEILNRANKKE